MNTSTDNPMPYRSVGADTNGRLLCERLAPRVRLH
jgi:hypothetical protein